MRFSPILVAFLLSSSALAAPTFNAEDRRGKSLYAGTRLIVLTGPGDVASGFDLGLYLAPELVVMAQYQHTAFDHIGYCSSSANTRSFGVAAQYFVGGLFYLSTGLADRQVDTALIASRPTRNDEIRDADGKESCEIYARAGAHRLDAQAGLGFQFNTGGMSFGLQLVDFSVPLTARATSKQFIPNTTYDHQDPGDADRASRDLLHGGHWSFLTFTMGISL